MTAHTSKTRTALVRHGFSEEDVWRSSLEPGEALHVSSTGDNIDAPDNLAAGGHRAGKVPIGLTYLREG